MIYTRLLQIPHVTADLFDLHIAPHIPAGQPVIYQVPFSSLVDSLNVIDTSGGVKQFCRLNTNGNELVHFTLLDPLGRRDIVTNSYIYIWTKAKNRIKLDMHTLKYTLDILRVDSFTTPSDFDIPSGCAEKRYQKSLRRTKHFLNELFSFGHQQIPNAVLTIAGGASLVQWTKMARELSELCPDVQAVQLDLQRWSESEMDGSERFDREFLTNVIESTLSHFPANKRRMVEGPFNPDQVLFLANHGIDTFDSSYAVLLAEKGMAFGLNPSFPSTSGHGGQQFVVLNLNDEIHSDDHSVCFPQCSCHLCQSGEGFTRAYLNHLLLCKEMLAFTLLTIHNMREWLKMFSILRNER